MSEAPKYDVVDRPAGRQGRPKVWDEIRERLKALPDKKSIRMKVPKGKTIRQFAQHVRAGIAGHNSFFPVTVSERPKENVIHVWEKREPKQSAQG